MSIVSYEGSGQWMGQVSGHEVYRGEFSLPYEERLELSSLITKLHGPALKEVLNIVKNEQSDVLSYSGRNCEYSFDVNKLRGEALRKLREYVFHSLGISLNRLPIIRVPSRNENVDIRHEPQHHQQNQQHHQPQLSPAKRPRVEENVSNNVGPDVVVEKRVKSVKVEAPVKKKSVTPSKKKKTGVKSQVVNKKLITFDKIPVGKLVQTVSGIEIYNVTIPDTPLRFRCGNCNKLFRKRSEVLPHIRTHTGEKPLKCKHCDRRFAHVSNLKSHERSHEKLANKNVKRKQSTTAVIDQSKAKNNQKSATAFKCSVPDCTQSFSDTSALREHLHQFHHVGK